MGSTLHVDHGSFGTVSGRGPFGLRLDSRGLGFSVELGWGFPTSSDAGFYLGVKVQGMPMVRVHGYVLLAFAKWGGVPNLVLRRREEMYGRALKALGSRSWVARGARAALAWVPGASDQIGRMGSVDVWWFWGLCFCRERNSWEGEAAMVGGFGGAKHGVR